MADVLIRLLAEQRKRAVASIMGHAERELFGELTGEQQREFRAKVINAIDVYSDFMRDLIKVGQADALVNEETLKIVSEIRERQLAQSRG